MHVARNATSSLSRTINRIQRVFASADKGINDSNAGVQRAFTSADKGINDSNAGVVPATENVAEAKIKRWLKQGGAENLSGPGYKHDRFKDAAVALGKGDDYLHSKILADNSIKPLSVTRRLEYDAKLEEVKTEIREDHKSRGSPPMGDYILVVEHSLNSTIEKLNKLAKQTNNAIISDSLKFNGMSPVRHVHLVNAVSLVRLAIQ